MTTLMEKYEQAKTKRDRAEVMADLMKATKKSERTILRWLKNGFPSARDAYNFALACGVRKPEALQLARECFPSGAGGAA